MKTGLLLCITAIMLTTSCGAGLVVRHSSSWDRTDLYGKTLVVIPGLGAAGIRFSDPNPNNLVDRHLKKRLPALPRFRAENTVYFRKCMEHFTTQKLWPVYNNLLKRFRNTGELDRLLLKQISVSLKTRYLLVPLYLSTGYTSWEFTGIFSYYSAALEMVLFERVEGVIVFRVRARGYSLGSPDKAFDSAADEVAKTLK